MSRTFRALTLTLLAALIAAAPASAASETIVVSEYRTRGPAGGNDEFIELRNRSAAPVDISGWLVRASNGSGTTGTRATIADGTSLGAGCAYLLANIAGSTAGAADAIYSSGVTDDGGVAVVSGTTVVDQVGQSAGSAYKEGTPLAPTPTNADQSYERAGKTADTDDNAADFSLQTAAEPESGCDEPGGDAPSVAATDPANGADEVDRDADLTVTFSEPVTAGDGAFALACAGDPVALAVSGGPSEYTLDPAEQLPRDASCTLTIEADAITDADGNHPAADRTVTFTTDSSVAGLRIHDIQGTSHISPYTGALAVGVPGVATAHRTNGYFVQDPQPDGDPRTSEGIFVFTGSSTAPKPAPGTAVTVTGRVTEFRAGGATSANLTVTELTSATALPAGAGTIPPTLVGRGGRVPPTTVIEDDVVNPGDVEQGDPLFDPQEDGIDFYESLEGMLTEVRNATVVGPTSDFGSNKEIPVLADGGAGAGVRADRGPVLVRGFDRTPPQEFRRGDMNPERITLNDTNDPGGTFLPLADVRDRFTEPVRAVVDYNFGAFKFLVVNRPALADGRLEPEVTRRKDRDELAVASYNVENLDGLDPQERYDRVAEQIVGNLRAPDILSLEEIQDNDGAAGPAPTAAEVTYARLIAAIRAAGGPTYDYRQVDPAPLSDGGEAPGNIRVAFLFRTDNRELRFVDRGEAGPATPTEPVAGPGGRPQLTLSPGRVDPQNPVFTNSRKPLAGEFRYRGRPLFLVGNHFNSKGGDDPLFGRFQEPRRSSEAQRHGQAGVVNAFVRQILDIDPRAHVIVLGDLNDFEFSETLRILERRALVNLWRLVPQDERYSYIFQGNGQVLDHILVSPWLLLEGRPDLDAVHINAEFSDQASDHDPPITRLESRGGR